MTLVGHEKPDLSDLAHHGTKGMHWGVRRDPVARAASGQARGQLKSVRLENAGKVREAAKSVSVKNPGNKDILAARAKQEHFDQKAAQARIQYKTAKAQYHLDKQEKGKVQAKIILEKNGKLPLQKARAKQWANFDVAQKQTSQEAINQIIGTLLGVGMRRH